ncbi:amidase [Microbulbifer sp. 2304DJ12-6]|uniref:amidase n=1 Tax=Microbulbifer sp. 2304DJ12-6 TaxID=3233340 RepID=UPI0039AFA7FA
MSQWIKILALGAVLSLAGCSGAKTPDLSEKSIAELQAMMSDGQLSSVQLVEYYQARIARYDQGEKGLNSIIVVNPDALDIARQLDQERAQEGSRGPLHGIPVLLKDNIDTADKMPNTAGSLLLKDNLPKRDAPLVAKLRAAGAVILGKANLSEWANFRAHPSSSGWSAVGGQVRNPYQEGANPCGSSGGSAVAVAADLVVVSVGTETDGSLTCPAAINGIVTIKPTLNLISQGGIIPIAHSQDTAGPMARTVADAALLLESMTDSTVNYSSALQKDGLNGKRIGVVRNLMGYDQNLDNTFDAELKALQAQGAELVDSCDIATVGQFSEQEFTVLLSEFKAGINAYLEQADLPEVNNLKALVEGNKQLADKELVHFGQELFEYALQAPALTDSAYIQAQEGARRLAGKEGIDAALDRCDVDLLIAPTVGPAWQTDYERGDQFEGSASSPAAVAGYPHITVPMGYVEGLPVGISFFSGANTESLLIGAAYSYEQATHHRTAPTLEWITSAAETE